MTHPTRKDLRRAARDYAPGRDFDRDAPHVDLTGPTVAVSIRLPDKMLAVLKACAERSGVGYQTLVKQWLHDRIQTEAGFTRRRPLPATSSLDTKVEEVASRLRDVQNRLATVESNERKVLQLVSK